MLKVYSKTNCPYCDKAKYYLKKSEIQFEEINVSINMDAKKFLFDNGYKTVPQFFVNDKLLVTGGWSGLSDISPEDLKKRIAALV